MDTDDNNNSEISSSDPNISTEDVGVTDVPMDSSNATNTTDNLDINMETTTAPEESITTTTPPKEEKEEDVEEKQFILDDSEDPIDSKNDSAQVIDKIEQEDQCQVGSQQQDEDRDKNYQDGSDNTNTSADGDDDAEAMVILNYLRKRGMTQAALDLEKQIQDEKKSKKSKTLDDSSKSLVIPDTKNESKDESLMDIDDLLSNNNVIKDEINDIHHPKSTKIIVQDDGEFLPDVDQEPITSTSDSQIKHDDGVKQDLETHDDRQNEVKRCLQGFISLQNWVLSLPDEEHTLFTTASTLHSKISDNRHPRPTNSSNDNTEEPEHISSSQEIIIDEPKSNMSTMPTHKGQNSKNLNTQLIPSSCKPELLSISFILFSHIYIELLECGLEQIAASLLKSNRHIYEPMYASELRDLSQSSKKEDIDHFNNLVKEYMDATAFVQKYLKYSATDETLKKNEILQYTDMVQKSSELKQQLDQYPFLRRVKKLSSSPSSSPNFQFSASLSSITYGYLVRYLRSQEALLPISNLLQSCCYLIVESRDPSPYATSIFYEEEGCGEDDPRKSLESIRWAAPIHPLSRAAEAGESISEVSPSLLLHNDGKEESVPFPKLHLNSEYDTLEEYEKDKYRVQFNRALLVNGFRRLEALEVKREYEIGMRKLTNTLDDTGITEGSDDANTNVQNIVNPLEPSILLSTLCASTTPSQTQTGQSCWTLEEAGIDITCAKLCPSDGRFVATGCLDSAVRIWSMDAFAFHSKQEKGSLDNSDNDLNSPPRESSIVLLGHKNGLPVFDLDWNKDGRTLLSAGGDGAVRLWDTQAVGSYGKLAHVARKTSSSIINSHLNKKTPLPTSSRVGHPTTSVPDLKPEPLVERNGAALVCYRGHVPSTPIWSVSFSPSGYYFASAGSDGTARLWCTDQPSPLRIFLGHYSKNINAVSWHPNCNYVFTGSDDKTVRMWDIHTGRCVRILSGCGFGVNNVQVSPSGRYAAGSDYGGYVHIWDVGTGKKVNELRHFESSGIDGLNGTGSMIHTMSYSPCGTTLATGGDDCMVRIWDVRGIANHTSNPEYAKGIGRGLGYVEAEVRPVERAPVTFRTLHTMVLDLKYTKRNLLLAAGKYIASGLSN